MHKNTYLEDSKRLHTLTSRNQKHFLPLEVQVRAYVVREEMEFVMKDNLVSREMMHTVHSMHEKTVKMNDKKLENVNSLGGMIKAMLD